MRILVVTWGSRGDFQPFIALGSALKARGHSVRLAGSPYAREWVEAVDLEFEPAGPLLTQSDLATGLEAVLSRGDAYRSTWDIVRSYLAPAIIPTFNALLESAAWADVIVAHHIQPAGRMLAERYVRPFATVLLSPHALPSRDTPPYPWPNLGPLGNSLLWRMGSLVLGFTVDRPINRERRRAGFGPIGDFFFRGSYSSALNLVAVSPAYLDRPADWPAWHKLTGFFYLEHNSDYTPDPSLERFLECGEPPVVVTFGSMLDEDPRSVTAVVTEALRLAGVRAVVQAGWAGLGADQGPGDRQTIFTGEVPHTWLLPRARAVIHHGGAGTTAATLRAGVPSIIVAHLADQFIWGRDIARREFGPPFLRRKDLRADRLAAAIRTALDDRDMAGRCDRLGRAIRAEDGVATAAGLLETTFQP